MSRSFQIAAPIASSSKQDPSRLPTASNPGPDTPHQRLLDQREILDQLADGEGIHMNEWEGLFEKCYMCKKFMLEAVYKAHIRDCWDENMMDIEESESEVDQ
jgi:hypothetical protein